MSTEAATQDNPYVLGPSRYRKLAQLRTKRHNPNVEGSSTGGGYERWRSVEYRPETARDGSEDVYVYHHRLLAVVACYPSEMELGEILDDMRGDEVHHSAPSIAEDRGVKWDNRPGALRVLDKGHHSEITQAEMRAWGEDMKPDTARP